MVGQRDPRLILPPSCPTDGVHFTPGFVIFFLPITRDLGLSRAAASLPFTVNKIIPTVLGPFMGALIDRLGPGRVLFVSAR